MKASELRIGNWWTNGENNYVMDISTMQDMVIALEDGFTDLFQPIPLTPEWLERFGVEGLKHTHRHHYNIELEPSDNRGGITLCYWFYPDGKLETVWLISGEIDDGDGYETERAWDYTKRLGMVHQLQNFYYTHKGDELELKENAIQ